ESRVESANVGCRGARDDAPGLNERAESADDVLVTAVNADAPSLARRGSPLPVVAVKAHAGRSVVRDIRTRRDLPESIELPLHGRRHVACAKVRSCHWAGTFDDVLDTARSSDNELPGWTKWRQVHRLAMNSLGTEGVLHRDLRSDHVDADVWLDHSRVRSMRVVNADARSDPRRRSVAHVESPVDSGVHVRPEHGV